MPLKHGHWYSMAKKIEGAHHTPDGRAIAIYVKAHKGQHPTRDASGNVTLVCIDCPEYLAVQAPDGHDHVVLRDRQAVPLRLHPSECPDLRLLEDLDHIPDSRKPRPVPTERTSASA